jgi:5-methylcytosine-specific restriction enzyme A
VTQRKRPTPNEQRTPRGPRKRKAGGVDSFYRGYPWRKVSGGVRRRDGYRCVKCGAFGKQVDHIISRYDGGAPLDPDNLQTLCVACHNAKTQKDKRNRSIRKANNAHTNSHADVCELCASGMQWDSGRGIHGFFG